ncbi:hypothetical protein J6590_097197 [Homalodisca vitripennis]|nr:hypothetical protein J6590_097197 [Homalodisca vitripennis]
MNYESLKGWREGLEQAEADKRPKGQATQFFYWKTPSTNETAEWRWGRGLRNLLPPQAKSIRRTECLKMSVMNVSSIRRVENNNNIGADPVTLTAYRRRLTVKIYCILKNVPPRRLSCPVNRVQLLRLVQHLQLQDSSPKL